MDILKIGMREGKRVGYLILIMPRGFYIGLQWREQMGIGRKLRKMG